MSFEEKGDIEDKGDMGEYALFPWTDTYPIENSTGKTAIAYIVYDNLVNRRNWRK